MDNEITTMSYGGCSNRLGTCLISQGEFYSVILISNYSNLFETEPVNSD